MLTDVEFGVGVDALGPYKEDAFQRSSWDGMEDLTPLQRVLLATDGTVTPVLGAYLGEPIDVRVLRQEAVTLTERDDRLALGGGRQVLERSVVLSGRHSGTVVLYADTCVALDRITAGVRADLLAGEVPIGLVLRRHRLETFREWLATGRHQATPDVARHLGPNEVCWRTYAVISRNRPLMVVHEEFPLQAVSRMT